MPKGVKVDVLVDNFHAVTVQAFNKKSTGNSQFELGDEIVAVNGVMAAGLGAEQLKGLLYKGREVDRIVEVIRRRRREGEVSRAGSFQVKSSQVATSHTNTYFNLTIRKMISQRTNERTNERMNE